jgi:CHAT domain
MLRLRPLKDPGDVFSTRRDGGAAGLYQQLFGSLEDKLAAATTVYVAPDGALNLVPFARLKLADGRYWGERQEVRLLQSGRDLLRPDPDRPARGLLALGGIDFSAAAIAEAKPDSLFLGSAMPDHAGAITRASGTFRDGFAQLAASGRRTRSRSGTDGCARMSRPRCGRVQLPARRGCWRCGRGRGCCTWRRMASILRASRRSRCCCRALRSPAPNRELAGADADGILFALEAQGLNLEGTELVVLSACDTAQGSLDYSEGVFGLARALRTAGARNVLVTQWKLNDGMGDGLL